MKFMQITLAASVFISLIASLPVDAQTQNAETPPAVAAKVALRGENNGVIVPEMRIVRKNDFLTVQADLSNTSRSDKVVFYRFRWLDASGNQVGDGESFKQLPMYGLQLQTVKSIAPLAAATDLRLEMNVESK